MKKLPIIFLLVCFTITLQAQKNPRNNTWSREISATFENDIFFLIDYYYTAGLDINYRRLTSPTSKLHRMFAKADSSRVTINYQGGIKIFTPYDIDFNDPKTMDRPYAGWSFIKTGVTSFPKSTLGNRYEAEAGLVGKVSGVGELQRWVHRITDFEVPHGWDYQIKNEAVLNLYYSRFYEMRLYDDLGVVTQSTVKAGTGGNKISQDVSLRIFQFNHINNSAYTQSRLTSDTRARTGKREIFVFVDVGVDYVLSDIFLEGSLFKNNKSVFTVPIQPWVIRRNFGIMFSSRSISWNITCYHISKEAKHNRSHDYASLGLAVRF